MSKQMLEQAVIDAISEWTGETTSDHLAAAARAAIAVVQSSADSVQPVAFRWKHPNEPRWKFSEANPQYPDYSPDIVEPLYTRPAPSASVKEATRHLVRMVRSLLRYTNPCNVAEDHSQQWQAVAHQCDVTEQAISEPARAEPQSLPTREEIARIIDPSTFAMSDHYFRKGIVNIVKADNDKALAKADAILAAFGQSQTDSSPQAASIDAEVAVQLVEALNDMEISAYNAAKYRIGRALRLLTSNASSQAVNVDLGRLIDWVYLYATEGSGWPDTKTVKDPLIALATKREPTQEDADCLKACGTLKQLLALSRPQRGET